jgi:hypothetical protein
MTLDDFIRKRKVKTYWAKKQLNKLDKVQQKEGNNMQNKTGKY